jgi:hypothetical protein
MTFSPGMTFDEFVEAVAATLTIEADDHLRSQHTFLTNSSGELGLDYVGRFERLERDFECVCRGSVSETWRSRSFRPFPRLGLQEFLHTADPPSRGRPIRQRTSIFRYDFGSAK